MRQSDCSIQVLSTSIHIPWFSPEALVQLEKVYLHQPTDAPIFSQSAGASESTSVEHDIPTGFPKKR
jgi:hypothetical protein